MSYEIDIKFTAESATRTLPLVRRIVEDILKSERQLQLLLQEHGEYAPLEPDYRQEKSWIDQFKDELADLGCAYRELNADVALVEYPAEINGEAVLLCWRSDEDRVAYYYPIGGSYEDRLPVPGVLQSVGM